MPTKKILLTGASGSVGIKTFQELINKIEKYDIRLFLRDLRKNKKLFKRFKNKIEIIWGDLLEESAIRKAIKGVDIIIHLAGVIPLSKYSNPYYTYAVNVEGTQHILNGMKEQDNPPKIIYTSSVAIYGDRRANPYIKVTDPLTPAYGDYYAETKIEAEKRIINSGLNFCIFRLAYCASTNTLKFHPVMFRMPLDTDIEIIGPSDVGRALVNALEHEEIWGNIYNLGGGDNCRVKYGDFLVNLYEIMGLGRDFLPKEAFSTIGYHCGYYIPEDLESLLKYQHFTLTDFYQETKKWIGLKRYFTPIVKWFLRKHYLKRSVYYRDYKKNTTEALK